MYNVTTNTYEQPTSILYGYVDGDNDNPMILSKDSDDSIGAYLSTEYIQDTYQAECLIKAIEKALELGWFE